MNLVYMRIATHIVATVRHMMLQARFADDCDGGSIKFGRTPGGGFNPGPSRSCSNVAIVARGQEIHVGRRIIRKYKIVRKQEPRGGEEAHERRNITNG